MSLFPTRSDEMEFILAGINDRRKSERGWTSISLGDIRKKIVAEGKSSKYEAVWRL